MKRRTFISHTAQAAITLSVVACKESPKDPYVGIPRPSLLSYMNETELLQVGYMYGQQQDSTVDHSGRSLGIAEDFEAGNTVIVDGWVLSRTEAQECLDFYQAVSSTQAE